MRLFFNNETYDIPNDFIKDFKRDCQSVSEVVNMNGMDRIKEYYKMFDFRWSNYKTHRLRHD